MTLDQVVDAVKPPRDLSRNPLFQVMFALQNIKLPPSPEMDLQITPLDDSPAPPSANFDLTLELFEREEGFQGEPELQHRSVPAGHDRPHGAAVRGAGGGGRWPSRSGASSSLPLLKEAERQKMLVEWNDTVRDLRPHAVGPSLVRGASAAAARRRGRRVGRSAVDLRRIERAVESTGAISAKARRGAGSARRHLSGTLTGTGDGRAGRAEGRRGLRAAGSRPTRAMPRNGSSTCCRTRRCRWW